jgi:hypothetical protein
MSYAREPIFWINLVKALAAIAVTFGVQITDDDTTKIAEVVALIAVFVVGHVVQRNAVTPAATPAIKEGTTATVLDATTGKPIGVTTVEVGPEVAGGDAGEAGDSVGGAV